MSHELTPREIVAELDKYIIGQEDAKKAVAIAIRNRWRRRQLDDEMQDEVLPKNIIMMGPTGVGKTEIARRLANLIRAPFIKIEATKFTEVGYVGRDVESMVRDLVDNAVNLIRAEHAERVQEQAKERAEERLLSLLLPFTDEVAEDEDDPDRHERLREKFREKLRDGELDDRQVELRVRRKQTPTVDIFSNQGIEQMGFDFQNVFDRLVPKKTIEKRLPVSDARKLLVEEEADKLLDHDAIQQEALSRTQSDGVIFLDELDKLAGEDGRGTSSGPDVSRGGVQRDLLPVVEGSTVTTRYGQVKTDHILFIAAGAFHVSKPSDLIPELQGRFPIRVELHSLDKGDFYRILTEPRNALTKQYQALLGTEGVQVGFTEEGLRTMAELAEEVNQTQNIGARRLHTIFEKLLEEALFDAPDELHEDFTVDEEFVREKLEDIVEDQDLRRYIL